MKSQAQIWEEGWQITGHSGSRNLPCHPTIVPASAFTYQGRPHTKLVPEQKPLMGSCFPEIVRGVAHFILKEKTMESRARAPEQVSYCPGSM